MLCIFLLEVYEHYIFRESIISSQEEVEGIGHIMEALLELNSALHSNQNEKWGSKLSSCLA